MSEELCIKGVDDICKAVGSNRNEFKRLVEEEGLPAWRRSEKDTWRALRDDLLEWMRGQREKYVKAS